VAFTQLATQYLFPAILMFMMFGLGLSLTGADFTRLLHTPRPAIVGILGHAVILPLVAFAILAVGNFPPLVAGGLVILAACPGGVSSNTLVYLGRGDVALAVSLTAISSVVTVFTIPLVIGFGLDMFAGKSATVRLDIFDTIQRLGAIILLPMFTGMVIRRLWADIAIRVELYFRKMAGVTLVALITGSGLLAASGTEIGDLPYAILAVLLLLAGVVAMAYAVCWLTRLDEMRTMTVVIETGVQNAATAFLIGGTILKEPGFILTPAVYAILMFAAAGLVIILARRHSAQMQ